MRRLLKINRLPYHGRERGKWQTRAARNLDKRSTQRRCALAADQ